MSTPYKRINEGSYSEVKTPEEALEGLEYPVVQKRAEIMDVARKHPNFVLVGGTGSGKTTCLPIMLLELKAELELKVRIAVTQPRLIATTSVSRRDADLIGCAVGQEIGYQVRFDDHTSEGTEINFMTDGVLLSMMQSDPLLKEFSIVMVDEAHERSLNIDLCLGLLKESNKNRLAAGMEPIRIVVTSATIEREKFARYIGNDETENSIEVPEKMFPVQVSYETQTPSDYMRAGAEKVHDIINPPDYTDTWATEYVLKHAQEYPDLYPIATNVYSETNAISVSEAEQKFRSLLGENFSKFKSKVTTYIKQEMSGDILVFMPGKEEIDKTIRDIEKLIDPNSVEIIRLHSGMLPEEQDRIFQPNGKRKIIVSTNIAETSITVPGVRHVVDSGYVKQIEFDPKSGIEQLVLTPHAISGLDQRMGRAGRVAPGRCYRLFSENSLRERQQYQTPEIQRSELAHVVLRMKKIGIVDVENFDFIDPPDRASIHQAIETLKTLGALDENGTLTETGNLMAELGLEPKLGRMVVEAIKQDCLEDICSIAAFLGGKSVFIRPEGKKEIADEAHARFKNTNSDFITYLNIWNAYVESGYDNQFARKNFLNGRVLDEANKVRSELLKVLRRNGIVAKVNGKRGGHNNNEETIGKAVTAGLIGSLMEYNGKHTFRRIDGTKSDIYMHPSSVTFGDEGAATHLRVAADVRENDKNKTYAAHCQVVNPNWILEVAPQLAKPDPVYGSRYDQETGKVVRDITYRLKGSYRETVVGKEKEQVKGSEALPVFVDAVLRGKVQVPDALGDILDANKDAIKKLHDLWLRAGGKIED
jgi:HrpA-like RNA helicase